MSANSGYGPDKARARLALGLSLLALLSIAVAAGSIWTQRSSGGVQVLSGKVLPDFDADLPQVRTVSIKSKGQSYSLLRAGNKWVMPERDGYPVSNQAMFNLAKQLTDLTYKSASSSDPAQFARLGVDDPSPDSNSALISIKGGTGQLMHSFYIGQKSETTFVRQAGSNNVSEANGVVSNLDQPSEWLDMAVLEILPENISTVSGQRSGEASYSIVRRPDGGFAPVGGQANSAATETALAITKWGPLDVKAASSLSTNPIASHVTSLRDGTIISIAAYKEAEGLWVVVSADTINGEGSSVATTLNQRTDGWAYSLDPTSFAFFAPSTADIVQGAGAVQP
jgi:hypothetical protein